MKRAVRSRRKVYGQLLGHARRQPHRECCGILAGQDGLITQAFPAKNVAADPVRNYEIGLGECDPVDAAASRYESSLRPWKMQEIRAADPVDLPD
jgi:proteasome lid subunit RPN8/RPN11